MATTKAAQEHNANIDQQMANTPAYAEIIVSRLTEHFLAGTPIPGFEDRPLNVARFYRIYRHIMAEGYGQG